MTTSDYSPDLAQRAGRIVRQNNENENVEVYRYITKNTFDAYLWQMIENKQYAISQIMTNKSPQRVLEDIDEMALNYAEIKALVLDNPIIKEKADIENEIKRLYILRSNYFERMVSLKKDIDIILPKMIKSYKDMLSSYEKDLVAKRNDLLIIGEKTFHLDSLKKEAGEFLLETTKKKISYSEFRKIGEYNGFVLEYRKDGLLHRNILRLRGEGHYDIEMGKDPLGNMKRLENALSRIPEKIENTKEKINQLTEQLEYSKKEVKKQNEFDDIIFQKEERLKEIDDLLASEYEKEEEKSAEEEYFVEEEIVLEITETEY